MVIESANKRKRDGVYLPPYKFEEVMRTAVDNMTEDYQRLSWDALRRSINGLINKVTATNIKNIVPELLQENLIRGRGLFCRSCMKSQTAYPRSTDVFSALVAVVNTKLPEIGELLLKRIVLQFERAYKNNDRNQLLSSVKFIAHLVNQQVAHEVVALELVTLLLENPTDDSVQVAVGFVKECGSLLQDLCPRALHGIFDRLRGILHEGEIDKRVQFLIEDLFAIRKAKFQGYPAVRPELDLIDHEDQLTHEISFKDEVNAMKYLDIFKYDPQFLQNEERYQVLMNNILDDASTKDEASTDDDSEESEVEEDGESYKTQIRDETESDLVNLRRTIYQIIMSSLNFEEAGNKLLQVRLKPGQEMEICTMLLECCAREKSYVQFYGHLGQRLCAIGKIYRGNFEKCFAQRYSTIHRLETDKIQNVAIFFAHLLSTDALSWHVLSYISLKNEDTTSAGRIFIKYLFQGLSEHTGHHLLPERFTDPSMQDAFESIFPKDTIKNTVFAINFFSQIGLGGITEDMRRDLKTKIRKNRTAPPSAGSSSSSSESESEHEVHHRKHRRVISGNKPGKNGKRVKEY